MMRAVMLAACALVWGALLRRSLGEVTANWLSTTWISTGARLPPPHARGWAHARHAARAPAPAAAAVILGTPLLRALLGPSYANLGVVAGVSSFIFQLPLMLVLFEVHTWREENLRGRLPEHPQPLQQAPVDVPSGTGGQLDKQAAPQAAPQAVSAADAFAVPLHAAAAGGRGEGGVLRKHLHGCMQWRMTRRQVRSAWRPVLARCGHRCAAPRMRARLAA